MLNSEQCPVRLFTEALHGTTSTIGRGETFQLPTDCLAYGPHVAACITKFRFTYGSGDHHIKTCSFTVNIDEKKTDENTITYDYDAIALDDKGHDCSWEATILFIVDPICDNPDPRT